MNYKVKIGSLAALDSFLKEHRDDIASSIVQKVYNLGCKKFLEYSLYILTQRHAVELFFYDALWITVYPKRYFFENCKNRIFTYDPDDAFGFSYICAEENMDGKIKKIMPYIENAHEQNVFSGIDIFLEHGKILRIRGSDPVPGAMDSWIEEKSQENGVL